MLHKYKIQTYTGMNYFFKTKEEVFSMFDDLVFDFGKRKTLTKYYYGRIKLYFTEHDFNFSLEGNFDFMRREISVYNIYSERYWNTVEVTRVNALYKLFDSNGFTVFLDDFIYDYCNSRNLHKKPKKHTPYNFGTKKAKRSQEGVNYANKRSSSNSFKSEFQSNANAKEQEVNIRAKRAKEVKFNCLFSYDDCNYRTSQRSWKSQGKKINQYKNYSLFT